MREGVWEMCNLSQGIKEEGIRMGKIEGIELGRSEERENTERKMQCRKREKTSR